MKFPNFKKPNKPILIILNHVIWSFFCCQCDLITSPICRFIKCFIISLIDESSGSSFTSSSFTTSACWENHFWMLQHFECVDLRMHCWGFELEPAGFRLCSLATRAIVQNIVLLWVPRESLSLLYKWQSSTTAILSINRYTSVATEFQENLLNCCVRKAQWIEKKVKPNKTPIKLAAQLIAHAR